MEKQFWNEVQMYKLAGEHPNIVKYYDHKVCKLRDGNLYLMIEHVNDGGWTLQDKIKSGDLVSEGDILRYFVQILHGVAHLHKR